MASKPLIRITDASFRKFQHTVFPDTTWEMLRGENWAVTGPNGSGKTTLLEAIEGRLMKIKGSVDYYLDDSSNSPTPDSYKHIASVYFSDRLVDYGDFYYQQRYHASQVDGIMTVRDFLRTDGDIPVNIKWLDMESLLDMEIIKLSNGQFKKMQIAKALIRRPRLLLLDNLYAGLDKDARQYITHTLGQITSAGTNIIMAVDRSHIPETVNRVMEIGNFEIGKTYHTTGSFMGKHSEQEAAPTLPRLPQNDDRAFETAIGLNGVSVAYGGKTVIDNAVWNVHQGDKWALMGPNGAGKSMLLSLVFADNPQAYANDIVLFDRQRGTGENIWEIKERIGFVSPEMHLYFNNSDTCSGVALGGLADNPYRKRPITDDVRLLAESLFDYFAIGRLEAEPFQRVSTGQQNVILLIRALVKNPALLILDEPFQGMDERTVRRARYLIDEYCRDRTLIFVSHSPAELPPSVDRCLLIEKGVVSNEGIE